MPGCFLRVCYIANLLIFENNKLTIGEEKNAIENFYNLFLPEFYPLK